METFKAKQDIAVPVAAVAHCALQSLLQDTALPVGLGRVPSPQHGTSLRGGYQAIREDILHEIT